MSHDLTVVVLAAGGGTRMRSKRMKVLHEVGGRSMVGHVLAAVQATQPTRIVAVVGHQREEVTAHVQQLVPDCLLAVQENLDGTGGAVRVALEATGPVSGTVLVAAGDTPLLDGDTLLRFAHEHEAAERAVSILTGVVDDPFGYGRILRNDDGDVEGIVEEKDATPAQREIHEINSGILAFDGEFLGQALGRLTNDNAKGEYYLTDVVGLAREDGLTVGAHVIAVAGGPEKSRFCREIGADDVIDHRSEDIAVRTRALTGGRGADVVYDPVGGRAGRAGFEATAFEGRFVVIGFASGEWVRIDVSETLFPNISLVGALPGAFPRAVYDRAHRELSDYWRRGAFTHVGSQVFDFADGRRAIEHIAAGAVQGKVVVRVR